MPQKDTLHELVKQALIKSGWEITDDPYIILYGKRRLFVDLGVVEIPNRGQVEERIIGAEREGKRIAIEVKEFRGKSMIADLEQAIGQYVLYRLLLNKVESEREIYLAISDIVYSHIFSEPIGKVVINDLPLYLLVVNFERMEIQQWIPSQPIAIS